MDKIYEQQFKRSRGDAAPGGEEEKRQGRKVAGGVWRLPALIRPPWMAEISIAFVP